MLFSSFIRSRKLLLNVALCIPLLASHMSFARSDDEDSVGADEYFDSIGNFQLGASIISFFAAVLAPLVFLYNGNPEPTLEKKEAISLEKEEDKEKKEEGKKKKRSKEKEEKKEETCECPPASTRLKLLNAISFCKKNTPKNARQLEEFATLIKQAQADLEQQTADVKTERISLYEEEKLTPVLGEKLRAREDDLLTNYPALIKRAWTDHEKYQKALPLELRVMY